MTYRMTLILVKAAFMYHSEGLEWWSSMGQDERRSQVRDTRPLERAKVLPIDAGLYRLALF